MSEVKPADDGEEWPPVPTGRQPVVLEPDLMPGKMAIGLSGLGWVLAILGVALGWTPGWLGMFSCVILPGLGFLVGLSGGRTWTAIVGRLMSLALIILYVLPQFVPK